MFTAFLMALISCFFHYDPNTSQPKVQNDSSRVHLARHVKDSLTQNLNQLELIIQKQRFNRCFAVDSVYFNVNNQLILSKGHYGCKKNITYYLAVFEANDIVYHEQYSFGDGLPYNKRILYSKNGVPYYGQKTDYELGWIDRKILDSTTVELPELQLKATYQEINNSTRELINLHQNILKSSPDTTYNGMIKLIHEHQDTYDEWSFTLDSDYYNEITR